MSRVVRKFISAGNTPACTLSNDIQANHNFRVRRKRDGIDGILQIFEFLDDASIGLPEDQFIFEAAARHVSPVQRVGYLNHRSLVLLQYPWRKLRYALIQRR